MPRGVLALVVAAVLLAGCKDRYRYECQDPANWEVPECQKPKCIASGYCTEYLITTSEPADEASK
jgi:hypothetical protein